MGIISTSDLNESHEIFNTIEKNYKNGDVSVKVLKRICIRKKPNFENHDHTATFMAREQINNKQLENSVLHFKVKQKQEDFEIWKTTQSKLICDDGDDMNFITKEQEEHRKIKAEIFLNKTKINIYDIAINNDWNYFITLTYSCEKVDRNSFSDCSKKIRKFMNNFSMRNKDTCPNFKYMIVHEKHLDGAFHFHGLIYLEDSSTMLDSGKRDKKHRKIYNWAKWQNGWSTATKVKNVEASCKYITKYITEDMKKDYCKGRNRYFCSRNCIKPTVRKYYSEDDEWEHLKPSFTSENLTAYEYNPVKAMRELFGDNLVIEKEEE